MRTFIAIKIIPESNLLHAITELKKVLEGEPVKWVDERMLHLTLKFIGETTEEQVQQVKSILGYHTQEIQNFSFMLEGVGYFKKNKTPHVLFANIRNGNVIKELAESIDTHLNALGFEKENRSFSPHLTLARIKFLKDMNNFYNAVEKMRDTMLQMVHVHDIVYYKSILKSTGPVYQELARFPF